MRTRRGSGSSSSREPIGGFVRNGGAGALLRATGTAAGSVGESSASLRLRRSAPQSGRARSRPSSPGSRRLRRPRDRIRVRPEPGVGGGSGGRRPPAHGARQWLLQRPARRDPYPRSWSVGSSRSSRSARVAFRSVPLRSDGGSPRSSARRSGAGASASLTPAWGRGRWAHSEATRAVTKRSGRGRATGAERQPMGCDRCSRAVEASPRQAGPRWQRGWSSRRNAGSPRGRPLG